jgi:hypothetical protein
MEHNDGMSLKYVPQAPSVMDPKLCHTSKQPEELENIDDVQVAPHTHVSHNTGMAARHHCFFKVPQVIPMCCAVQSLGNIALLN